MSRYRPFILSRDWKWYMYYVFFVHLTVKIALKNGDPSMGALLLGPVLMFLNGGPSIEGALLSDSTVSLFRSWHEFGSYHTPKHLAWSPPPCGLGVIRPNSRQNIFYCLQFLPPHRRRRWIPRDRPRIDYAWHCPPMYRKCEWNSFVGDYCPKRNSFHPYKKRFWTSAEEHKPKRNSTRIFYPGFIRLRDAYVTWFTTGSSTHKVGNGNVQVRTWFNQAIRLDLLLRSQGCPNPIWHGGLGYLALWSSNSLTFQPTSQTGFRQLWQRNGNQTGNQI